VTQVINCMPLEYELLSNGLLCGKTEKCYQRRGYQLSAVFTWSLKTPLQGTMSSCEKQQIIIKNQYQEVQAFKFWRVTAMIMLLVAHYVHTKLWDKDRTRVWQNWRTATVLPLELPRSHLVQTESKRNSMAPSPQSELYRLRDLLWSANFSDSFCG
jgi:hypothetical protein